MGMLLTYHPGYFGQEQDEAPKPKRERKPRQAAPETPEAEATEGE